MLLVQKLLLMFRLHRQEWHKWKRVEEPREHHRGRNDHHEMTDPLDPWHVMTFARVSFWRSFRVSFIFALLTDKERTRPILLVAGRRFLHKVVYGTSLPAALFLYPTSESRLFLSSRAVASADVDYETGRLVVINIMRRKAVGRNIIHLLLFEHTR